MPNPDVGSCLTIVCTYRTEEVKGINDISYKLNDQSKHLLKFMCTFGREQNAACDFNVKLLCKHCAQ